MFSSSFREPMRLGKFEGANQGMTLPCASGLYQVWRGSPGRSAGPAPLSVTSVNSKAERFGLYESGYANENGQGHCHGSGQ